MTQKRVHMFYKVRKISPYLHTYWMNLDNLNCAGKVHITAFWPYFKYAIILYICWDNPIIVQLHMWTLFLLLNFMYYLLDYSTKSNSNSMKLCMQIYTYHFMFPKIIRSLYSFIIEKYKIYYKHTIFCIFLIFYI